MNLSSKNMRTKISYILLYSYLALLITGAFHYHTISLIDESSYSNEPHQVSSLSIDKCIICHFNSTTYDVPSSIVVNSGCLPLIYLPSEPLELFYTFRTNIFLRGPPLFLS